MIGKGDNRETLELYKTPDSELKLRGERSRGRVPREDLGVYTKTERDPVAIITDQNAHRLHDLVPLRHSRMAASPFSFFRGAAALMAFDLSHQAQTPTQVVISGDAHIGNFGLYASPERRLVFDLNDFDEAAPGPWEWDIKRTLTSAILAGQENGFTAEEIDQIVHSAAGVYRSSLADFVTMPALDRLYASVDSTVLAERVRAEGLKAVEKTTKKAWRNSSDRTIAHLMGPDEFGVTRFLEHPPILEKISNHVYRDVSDSFPDYQTSAFPDIAYLLTQYTITDIARRVVGVGSVGTRCYLVALTGPDGGGLVLQLKEATESVVTKYSKRNVTTPPTIWSGMPEGERVIVNQRILQAFSDPFLGHLESKHHAFYVRQYRDAKGSFDTSTMSVAQLHDYVSLCAHLVARAHSQSPMASWICGYLGNSDAFADAMVPWCNAYAEQSNTDYQTFKEAVDAGDIESSDFAEG